MDCWYLSPVPSLERQLVTSHPIKHLVNSGASLEHKQYNTETICFESDCVRLNGLGRGTVHHDTETRTLAKGRSAPARRTETLAWAAVPTPETKGRAPEWSSNN